jgi:mono/diheme cytochrome c family protein
LASDWRGLQMKRQMVWSMAVTTLLASAQAQAQQREVGGLSVAKAVCSRCHAVEKNSPRSHDAAAPRFEDIANSPGITARTISKALQTTPHRRMPNFRMNRGVLDDLVTYILSLKRI